MVRCPKCEVPGLAASSARLGTPAFPIRCRGCGTEFHGSLFWWSLPATVALTVAAFLGAILLTAVWNSSVAVLLSFGIAIALGLVFAHRLSQRQVPVQTRRAVKMVTRLVALALLAYLMVQVTYDMLAA